MKIDISKYIGKNSENGLYLDPFVMHKVIIEESKVDMSFNELKKFYRRMWN